MFVSAVNIEQKVHFLMVNTATVQSSYKVKNPTPPHPKTQKQNKAKNKNMCNILFNTMVTFLHVITPQLYCL